MTRGPVAWASGDSDATVADGELDEWTIGPTCEVEVEADICGHMRRPLVIAVGEGLVPGEHDHERTPSRVWQSRCTRAARESAPYRE